MRRTRPAVRWALLALSVLLCGGLATAADYSDNVLEVKASISGERIVSHIDFLASEHCRGRETGEKGMDVAAAYLASVLKGAGLERAGEYGGYRQWVDLKKVSLSPESYLRVAEETNGNPLVREAKLEWDYIPVSLSAEVAAQAPVAFAGYGITAPEHGYDDYAGLKAEGKIVLVMRHEPGEKDPDSPFDGRKASEHSALLSKIRNAHQHGAVGILFVTDPLNHSNLTPSATSGTWWPSLRKERMKDDEDFRYMRFRPDMKLVDTDYGVRIPAVAIDSQFAAYLLGHDRSLEEIQQVIDENLQPGSFLVPGKTLSLGVAFDDEPAEAYNIVARVTGSDPELKDEFVVVGAHYDHEGKDNRGQVYHGADDNASGTAGVLELARAFQSLSEKPARTLVFVLFTAEEKGLLGSRHYAENPVFPLDRTIAMFNLDMIGRNDVDQISFFGRYQYPKLWEIVDRANRASVNFEVNFSVEQFLRNSDQFPFMREGVPSVFLNTGSHDQLHEPEDTSDRILADKAEKVVQLAFLSLWEIANAPAGTSFAE